MSKQYALIFIVLVFHREYMFFKNIDKFLIAKELLFYGYLEFRMKTNSITMCAKFQS